MSKTLANSLRANGISNERVLQAIACTPREQFVATDLVDLANTDQPLPIGFKQTISQPYVVARMTELLLKDKQINSALEIGTGSGYQAAILSKLVKSVFSIERIKPLYQQVRTRLTALGYNNIKLKYADGMLGWPEHAPFDAIILTAAIDHLPDVLIQQLAIGGHMILPLGESSYYQNLCLVTKKNDGKLLKELFDLVMFVPILSGKQEDL